MIWPSIATGQNFDPRSPHGERRPACAYHCPVWHFDPRSPHGERRYHLQYHHHIRLFRSTLSSRRATAVIWILSKMAQHFDPRSPHGERLQFLFLLLLFFLISIHALLTESDCMPKKKTDPDTHFDPRSPHGERLFHLMIWILISIFRSTLSSRRATDATPEIIQFVMISIHALLTESDGKRRATKEESKNFDPRSPHGERPRSQQQSIVFVRFRSTLSSRRATQRNRFPHPALPISIHALLTESDATAWRWISASF